MGGVPHDALRVAPLYERYKHLYSDRAGCVVHDASFESLALENFHLVLDLFGSVLLLFLFFSPVFYCSCVSTLQTHGEWQDSFTPADEQVLRAMAQPP